jgi:hypothetical protein
MCMQALTCRAWLTSLHAHKLPQLLHTGAKQQQQTSSSNPSPVLLAVVARLSRLSYLSASHGPTLQAAQLAVPLGRLLQAQTEPSNQGALVSVAAALLQCL